MTVHWVKLNILVHTFSTIKLSCDYVPDVVKVVRRQFLPMSSFCEQRVTLIWKHKLFLIMNRQLNSIFEIIILCILYVETSATEMERFFKASQRLYFFNYSKSIIHRLYNLHACRDVLYVLPISFTNLKQFRFKTYFRKLIFRIWILIDTKFVCPLFFAP